MLEVEQLVLHQMPEEEEPREGSSAELGRKEPDSTPASLQATKVGHDCLLICSFASSQEHVFLKS